MSIYFFLFSLCVKYFVQWTVCPCLDKMERPERAEYLGSERDIFLNCKPEGDGGDGGDGGGGQGEYGGKGELI